MNPIKECFDIILRSDKNESRLAARRVRKLPYKSIQMVLADLEDSCGQKYIEHLVQEIEEMPKKNIGIA